MYLHIKEMWCHIDGNACFFNQFHIAESDKCIEYVIAGRIRGHRWRLHFPNITLFSPFWRTGSIIRSACFGGSLCKSHICGSKTQLWRGYRGVFSGVSVDLHRKSTAATHCSSFMPWPYLQPQLVGMMYLIARPQGSIVSHALCFRSSL